MRGKLIVLESIDGGGKSTQVKEITKYFQDKNLKYIHYHFPMYGHNQFSDMIARFLRGEFGNIEDVDPLWVANMYALDRFRFLPELEKALEENDVVLLDRYVFSNIAYQCAKFENEKDAQRMKEWIFEFEFGFLGLPYPDLNIFLDVPTDVAKKRLEEHRDGEDRTYLNGKQDIHEADFEFQKRVRDNYLISMGNAPNCKIISCASQLGEEPNNQWFVFPPDKLFEFYKEILDYILIGDK